LAPCFVVVFFVFLEAFHFFIHLLFFSTIVHYFQFIQLLVVVKMVKYFTADEISMHNCASDCWVSIFDNVYDLTPLLEENKGNWHY